MPLNCTDYRVTPVSPIDKISERPRGDREYGEGVPHDPGGDEFKKMLAEQQMIKEPKEIENRRSLSETELPFLPSTVNDGHHVDMDTASKAYRDRTTASTSVPNIRREA